MNSNCLVWIVHCGILLPTLLLNGANEGLAAETTTISGEVRLNEFLASNQSGRMDDEGENSDWVEIHNPSDLPLNLAGYFLTDDPEVCDKWPFPRVKIPAGGFYLIWMSGRNRHSPSPEFLQSATSSVPFEKTLIAPDANWRMLLPDSDDSSPAGWVDVEFDDSAFTVGKAGFGYGDEDDSTILPTGSTVVLLRHEFQLDGSVTPNSLVLDVDYDDGFAAYLNGERIASANAPAGKLGFEARATASHEAGVPSRFSLAPYADLLREGANILAIAGMNTHAGSSDMTIRASLGTLPLTSHAGFRLKKKEGGLFLVDSERNITDQITYGKQHPDQSFGRSASGEWGVFLTPTPGVANSGPQQTEPIRSRVSYEPAPGAVKSGTVVQIREDSTADVRIHFTTDGSAPDAMSPQFETPVTLEATSVLRAASFVGDERVSPIESATYLVGERPTLPVLSLSMNPADFREVHLQSAATGRTSERPAFLEIIDPAGSRTLATEFGFRLHGGASRRGGLTSRKSYRTYFRKYYGLGRVEFPVIPEADVTDFDKLVLRANANDRGPGGTYLRDQVIRDLHSDMGGLAAAGSWYVLLVNSTSFGVYNVTERMDEEFFASHLGPGEFDVIKTGETLLSGSRAGWDDLRRFVTSTDFSDNVAFEQLAQRVDVENLTSYIIVNLCLQNYDWPHNNWYAARPAPDGKWKFLCWDSEWGLGYQHPGALDAPYGRDVDPYAFMDSGGASGHGLIRTLFFAMIENPGYCDYYQAEVRRHLEGALSQQNILRQVHRHRDAIAADVAADYITRGHDPKMWNDRIATVEDFAQHCGASFQRFTDEYFSHTPTAADSSRMAISVGPSGARHVIYRTEKGRLREIVSSADEAVRTDRPLRVPVTVPDAAGQPQPYSTTPGDRRILFRGAKGHLHELALAVGSESDAVWRHTDLTTHLEQPTAACDPSVVVTHGVPHIVFVDETSRAHELWQDGAWQHHPLPAAPRPAGRAVISSTDFGVQVSYRTMFGVACVQTVSRGDGVEHPNWSHRLFHRIPGQGQPLGFHAGGRQRLIFRATEEWPLREPFVFRWHARRQPGFREYEGPRNSLVQVWSNGERFHRLESIGGAHSPAAGNPFLAYDSMGDRHYVVYRDIDGQIREAALTLKAGPVSENNSGGGSWNIINITALAEAPPASGDPVGLVSAENGSRYYVYRGTDGHHHELKFDDVWQHIDLTTAAAPAD